MIIMSVWTYSYGQVVVLMLPALMWTPPNDQYPHDRMTYACTCDNKCVNDNTVDSNTTKTTTLVKTTLAATGVRSYTSRTATRLNFKPSMMLGKGLKQYHSGANDQGDTCKPQQSHEHIKALPMQRKCSGGVSQKTHQYEPSRTHIPANATNWRYHAWPRAQRQVKSNRAQNNQNPTWLYKANGFDSNDMQILHNMINKKPCNKYHMRLRRTHRNSTAECHKLSSASDSACLSK